MKVYPFSLYNIIPDEQYKYAECKVACLPCLEKTLKINKEIKTIDDLIIITEHNHLLPDGWEFDPSKQISITNIGVFAIVRKKKNSEFNPRFQIVSSVVGMPIFSYTETFEEAIEQAKIFMIKYKNVDIRDSIWLDDDTKI